MSENARKETVAFVGRFCLHVSEESFARVYSLFHQLAFRSISHNNEWFL